MHVLLCLLPVSCCYWVGIGKAKVGFNLVVVSLYIYSVTRTAKAKYVVNLDALVDQATTLNIRHSTILSNHSHLQLFFSLAGGEQRTNTAKKMGDHKLNDCSSIVSKRIYSKILNNCSLCLIGGF